MNANANPFINGVEVGLYLRVTKQLQGQGMKPPASKPMTPSFAVTTYSGKFRIVTGISVMNQ